MDDLTSESNLPTNQAQAMLNKAVKKIFLVFNQIIGKESQASMLHTTKNKLGSIISNFLLHVWSMKKRVRCLAHML